MADLKKVSSGEKLKIPASTYNVFIDTAQDYLKRQNRQTGGDSRTPLQSKFVLVKNTTASAVNRFGVLGISNSELSVSENYFKQNIILTGTAPSSTSHSSGRFVIVHEPIAAGGVGRAYINGHCQVQINVTDANHTFCDVKDGDSTKLESAESGPAVIIWKESGTGTKWAIIRFGGSGGSSGAASLLWCEIMHEPDVGSTYYKIKLDAWATAWSAGTWYQGPVTTAWIKNHDYSVAIETTDANKIKVGEKYYKCVTAHTSTNSDDGFTIDSANWQEFIVSFVKYEYPSGQWREFTCKTTHGSTASLTPTNANYWSEIDGTKAYLYGVYGPIHTTYPQFSYGMKVPVVYKDDEQKYYLVGAFTQGGVPAGSTLIAGSTGWIRYINGYPGRAGAFFR